MSRFRRDDASTWGELARKVVENTVRDRVSAADRAHLAHCVAEMKLMPSVPLLLARGAAPRLGDTLLLRAGEGAEEAGRVTGLAQAALWRGAQLGIDFSAARSGAPDLLARIDAVDAVADAASRRDGARRRPRRPSSVMVSLAASHPDLEAFLAPADHASPPGATHTRRMVHFDTAWLLGTVRDADPGPAFRACVGAAMRRGDVSLGFDLFAREAETLRSPAGHVTGREDGCEAFSASIDLSRIGSLGELADVTQLATQFLLCAAATARPPREGSAARPPRIALGLMGLHEWLVRRGLRYGPDEELGLWLAVYRGVSDETAAWFSDALGQPRPSACRAAGADPVLARLAGTTSGIEPLPAVAFRIAEDDGRPGGPVRIHPVAESLSARLGIALDRLDSALALAADPGRSLAVQASVQDHVDQAACLAVVLPRLGEDAPAEQRVQDMARLLARHAHGLRTVSLEPEGAFGRPVRIAADPAEARERPAEAA